MMKKYIALIVAVALILTLTACRDEDSPPGDSGGVPGQTSTGGADAQAGTPPGDSGQDPQGGGQADTPAAGLIGWMQSGTYYMKYTVDADFAGVKSVTKGTMAERDGDVLVISETTVEGMTMKTRTILVDNVMWLVDETSGIMYKFVDTEPDDEITHFSEIDEPVGTGTGVVNGRTLPYEEHMVWGFSIKFYIDGGEVYAVVTEGEGVLTVMLIEEVSDTIPPGSFDLPQGDYQIIEI